MGIEVRANDDVNPVLTDWKDTYEGLVDASERVNDFAPLEVMSLVSNRAAARA